MIGGDGGAHLGLNHILAIAAAKQEVARNITPLCQTVRDHACLDKLNQWLRSRADILFVIGYCVIAFLKLSFLGILRYEIREMIQKIKLLQTEMANALCSDTEQPHNATVSKHAYKSIPFTPDLSNCVSVCSARSLRPPPTERD